MAFVRVEQRNAHLAGPVRLEFVNGREGKVAKATLTAITNSRRGGGEEREEEATAIQWTLWGKQAENAAEYLGKGSHVNVVGRVRNNNYRDAERRECTRWPSPARRSTTSTARPSPRRAGRGWRATGGLQTASRRPLPQRLRRPAAGRSRRGGKSALVPARKRG